MRERKYILSRPDFGDTRLAQAAAVVKAVASAYGFLDANEIHTHCRRVEVMWPRQVCLAMQREFLGATCTELSTWWEISKAAVSHNLRHVEIIASIDPGAARTIEQLKNQLKEKPDEPKTEEMVLAGVVESPGDHA